VLCGDDDVQTHERSGTNPGRAKATAAAAARAVHGLAVFPEGLPSGGSDFNDLHAHIGGAAGLAEVRRIVQAAIEAHQAGQRAAQSANGGKGRHTHRPAPEAASGAADDQACAFDPFTVDDAGVWHHGTDQDGGGWA
jgi:putative DNA primase/helicase